MTDVAIDREASYRELTNNAFLELFFYEELRKNPQISDEELLRRSRTGIRGYFLYRVWFVRDRLQKHLKRHADYLRQKICIEWQYCKSRPTLDELEPWVAVTGELAHVVFDVFLPFSLAWLLLIGLLDEFCGCPRKRFDSIRQLVEWLRKYGRQFAERLQTYGPVTPDSIRKKLQEVPNPDGLAP